MHNRLTPLEDAPPEYLLEPLDPISAEKLAKLLGGTDRGGLVFIRYPDDPEDQNTFLVFDGQVCVSIDKDGKVLHWEKMPLL